MSAIELQAVAMREALHRGRQLGTQALEVRSMLESARTAQEERSREVERLEMEIQSAAADERQAEAKFGVAVRADFGEDEEAARQLCRGLFEKDRIAALIKKTQATITAWRWLWSLAQKADKTKTTTGAKAAEQGYQQPARSQDLAASFGIP